MIYVILYSTSYCVFSPIAPSQSRARERAVRGWAQSLRSASGAHLLDVENSVGRVRAKVNMMLSYMHVESKMICWAILHACSNLGSVLRVDILVFSILVGLHRKYKNYCI